ncbi:MAG: hypothetical protein CME65_04985 [Halobacteriovoraceae bacterium]|nr:hypothetical protein [Halobacteriovoraceae bacterium]|tara:strand:+ start:3530 stop:4057 length:528 start_codon:yes stop_codon:yes gene_type:complete
MKRLIFWLITLMTLSLNFAAFAYDSNITVGPRANLVEKGSTTDFISDDGNCYTVTRDSSGEDASQFVPLKTTNEESINKGPSRPGDVTITMCSTAAGSGAGDCTCSFQCYSGAGDTRTCTGSAQGGIQTGYTFRANSEQACLQVQSACRTYSSFANFPPSCTSAVMMSSCGFVAD